MDVAVVVFPGSNCEQDVTHLYGDILGQSAREVWHEETDLGSPDLVVLPGGFSYGDYLRCGAMAKLSSIMNEVTAFAQKGGPVIGICNGFQILCEAGLLPGVLLQNRSMKFISKFLHIRVENTETAFTKSSKIGDVLACPVAHFEGNYFAAPETLDALEDNSQIIFRYCDPKGVVDPESKLSNPNGSVNAIAGICNAQRNVIGLMPHPERSAEQAVGYLGGSTGRVLFESVLSGS